MPIPKAESAFVPLEKLTGYLLNAARPIGGPKARWFFSLGYSRNTPKQLELDLLELVRRCPALDAKATRHGIKYTVRGRVRSPNGRRAMICTVWIAECKNAPPRLVTAYPAQGADHE